jgi:anaerobic selenocysteine-containing dehydrogenase
MHLSNPKEKEAINRMFGHSEWQMQPFMKMHGKNREKQFLEYLLSQIGAQYSKEFRVRFSPEDRVSSDRTKYYLIHFSNHLKAVLLMKQIMWNLGDEEGTFDYSASHQGVLFSGTPQVQELIKYLQKAYVGSGREITFLQLQEETYRLPFIEKHYREAIKQMEAAGEVVINRVESKKTGIKDGDIITFSKKGGTGYGDQ